LVNKTVLLTVGDDRVASVPPVTADDCVVADQPCDQCGHNLYTLAKNGRCPESGHPVAETLRPDDLQFAPPAYVRAFASGCRLLAVATLFFLADALG
jgi:hypothetical protein